MYVSYIYHIVHSYIDCTIVQNKYMKKMMAMVYIIFMKWIVMEPITWDDEPIRAGWLVEIVYAVIT